jgi:hypothetical protein
VKLRLLSCRRERSDRIVLHLVLSHVLSSVLNVFLVNSLCVILYPPCPQVPLPPFHQKYRKVITYRLNLQPLKQSQQAFPKLVTHFLIFLCDLCIGYMEFLLVAVLLLLDLTVQTLEFEVHEAFDVLPKLGLFGAAFIIFVDALTGGTERMGSDESAGDEAS